ncbi:arginase family protein [Nocardiopsis ansamitocini]|uniref:Arginase n=1 Tax=Nocardiopsis ansamitocini TaxID=1670832 RepID=A0A9W6P6P6_9ACTN|nr:arginase family protein [Nocardiopsis ansamitocini]GLU48460.1 hypothetical protein Nans01_28110 [Nocardiopsis ansamitocini]
MVWQRDIDLVVPLWQGGDDVRVAAGSAALARMVPSGGNRLHVSVPDGRRGVVEGVANLDVLADTVHQLGVRLAGRDARRVLTLGGDCTSDLAAMRHLTARYPSMVVYWVDAHPDLNTADVSPSHHAHGMVLRLLLGQGHPRLLGGARVAPTQVTLVGARSVDPPEQALIKASGMPVMGVAEVRADPYRVVGGRAQGSPAYVHLDMDVCDPAQLPAVACPTPGGPPVESVAAALAAIHAHHEVVGVGISEYAPVIEHDEATVRSLLRALDLRGVTPNRATA